MALIPCRECGETISDQAITCPKCGCPVVALKAEDADAKTEKKNKNTTKTVIVVVLISVLVVALLIILLFVVKGARDKKTRNSVMNSISDYSKEVDDAAIQFKEDTDAIMEEINRNK